MNRELLRLLKKNNNCPAILRRAVGVPRMKLVRHLSFRHKPETRLKAFFWIPACAGMTVLIVSEQVNYFFDNGNLQRPGGFAAVTGAESPPNTEVTGSAFHHLPRLSRRTGITRCIARLNFRNPSCSHPRRFPVNRVGN